MRPRCHRIRSGLLLTLVAGVACSDGPTSVPLDDVPAAFRTATVPVEGWTRIERPGFSFYLPPGFVDAGLQPIDSDAARFHGPVPGASLYFDYGPYTARTRAPEGATEIREVWTTIGGRSVQLMAWLHQGTHVVVGWWPDVTHRRGMANHLKLGGSYADGEGRDDLLAALRSVRFP